jgi:hypothetical protein
MSFIKVEYKSLVEGSKKSTWLKKLTIELGILEEVEATNIWCDNMSILKIAKNPILHARTKHIEVHYHYVCEQVELGHIDVAHIFSNNQLANMFTKPLGKMKFEKIKAN